MMAPTLVSTTESHPRMESLRALVTVADEQLTERTKRQVSPHGSRELELVAAVFGADEPGVADYLRSKGYISRAGPPVAA